MKLAMRALMVLALAGLGLACGDDTVTKSDDTTPPAAIENLVAGGPTSFTVGLLWTAVGDDSLEGTANRYDIRYSLTPINEASFGKAVRATGVRNPEPPGKPDNFTVSGLNASTTYYFAIKAGDDAGNWSPLSNVVSLQTALPPDKISPARVANLAVADSTPFTVTLVWTAVGDDSTAGTPDSVDVRFSIGLITESNFGSAAEAIHFSQPKAAGQPESLVVTGLRDTTRYYFCLRVVDESNNWSEISNVVSARTLIREQVPPAPIFDLAILDKTFGTVRLGWTAPGDDGNEGTAFQYDIRYSTIPITEGNWLRESTKVGGRPKPKSPGSAEEFTIRNLQGSTEYFFAIRTLDEVANMSGLSNLVNCTTLVAPDTVPPINILFLNVADSSRNSVTLTWLTPGDDGTLGQATTYDIRYGQAFITESNWETAFQAALVPVLQQPGGNERYTVTGLKPNTRYYFAIKTADEVPNWSRLSQVATAFTSD